MNGVNITLEKSAFSVGFTDFLTKSNVTIDGDIEEDENKFKRFLIDIRYDLGKGDEKSSTYRTIKRVLMGKGGVYGKGLIKDKLNNHDNHSYKIDQNNLVERLD